MRMVWLSTWALARVRLRDEACILYIWAAMAEYFILTAESIQDLMSFSGAGAAGVPFVFL